MNEQNAFAEKIISALGGVSAVARRYGISAASVSEWKTAGRIPEERLIRIAAQLESAGVATRKDLFPDDWHLIWPEIIEDRDVKELSLRALVKAPLNQQPLFVFAQEILLGAWKEDEICNQAIKAMRAQRELVLSSGG